MIYLNRDTKQAKAFVRAYKLSNVYTVNDAYERPSQAKLDAERRIYDRDARDEAESEKSPFLCRVRYSDYKITGFNCSYFTVARKMSVYGYGDEYDTIINEYLIVDTPTRTYQIWLYDITL